MSSGPTGSIARPPRSLGIHKSSDVLSISSSTGFVRRRRANAMRHGRMIARARGGSPESLRQRRRQRPGRVAAPYRRTAVRRPCRGHKLACRCPPGGLRPAAACRPNWGAKKLSRQCSHTYSDPHSARQSQMSVSLVTSGCSHLGVKYRRHNFLSATEFNAQR